MLQIRNTMGKIDKIQILDKPKEPRVSNAGQITVLLFFQLSQLRQQWFLQLREFI